MCAPLINDIIIISTWKENHTWLLLCFRKSNVYINDSSYASGNQTYITVNGEDVCSVLAKIICTIQKINKLFNREQNLQVIKSYKNKVNNMCKNPCNVLKVTRREMEIEKHCMTSRQIKTYIIFLTLLLGLAFSSAPTGLQSTVLPQMIPKHLKLKDKNMYIINLTIYMQ